MSPYYSYTNASLMMDSGKLGFSSSVYLTMTLGKSYYFVYFTPYTVVGNFTYGTVLLGAADNPLSLILYSAGTTVYITAINQTEMWDLNYTVPATWGGANATMMGTMGATIAAWASSPWGQAALTATPLFIILISGRHYLWVMGVISTMFCFMVDTVTGGSLFSQTALAFIFFICIGMAIEEGQGK
jgi:hypothetical protein